MSNYTSLSFNFTVPLVIIFASLIQNLGPWVFW